MGVRFFHPLPGISERRSCSLSKVEWPGLNIGRMVDELRMLELECKVDEVLVECLRESDIVLVHFPSESHQHFKAVHRRTDDTAASLAPQHISQSGLLAAGRRTLTRRVIARRPHSDVCTSVRFAQLGTDAASSDVESSSRERSPGRLARFVPASAF